MPSSSSTGLLVIAEACGVLCAGSKSSANNPLPGRKKVQALGGFGHQISSISSQNLEAITAALGLAYSSKPS